MKRTIVLFILVPLFLFVVLWTAVEFTPQEKFRQLAAQQIGQRINRQLEIGPVHFGLRGLTIETLKFSEVPSFKAGVLFFAKNVRLGWSLRALWEGFHFKTQSITRSSGSFHIDDFENPHYIAHDFSVNWSLSDIDPGWSHLNGWAKLEQGRGLLQNVDQLMAASPSAKVALMPVLALMNLEKMGILKIGLPDLRHWPIQKISGDYTFKQGSMKLETFTIDSPQLGMGTTGVVELGSGALALDVQLHAPPRSVMGEMDAKVRVSGTLSHPKVDLDSLKKKAFRATLNNLLQNPQDAKKDIDQTLKNIFH